MDSIRFCKISPIISAFVIFLFFISSLCSVQSLNFNNTLQNFQTGIGKESKELKYMNKPAAAVKTIQSPDGDLIDCVPSHLQPAFDHPLLKGQKPLMDPPEMPKWHTSKTDIFEESFQVWSMSGESCPENTIPIRRTTEEDILRAKSVPRFGRKSTVGKYGNNGAHEHAIGYMLGKFSGVEATINVWYPKIGNENEISFSQIWVTAGTFGDRILESIEAGWKVAHGDKNPTFFIYWTSDAYNQSGCYNLDCPGFVMLTNYIALGGGIRKFSSYNGPQFDITLLFSKDKKTGNWWLYLNNISVGYWPSQLFNYLGYNASMVEFGGEITNTGSLGHHTATEMGSGHFPEEGFGNASYIRNIQVTMVDSDNNKTTPTTKVYGRSEKPGCYYAGTGSGSKTWGTYIFYGGPGNNGTNPKCS